MKSSTIRQNLHKLEPGQVDMLFSSEEGIKMLGLKETTLDGDYTQKYDHSKIPNSALEELVKSPNFSKSLLESVFQKEPETTDPNQKLQELLQSSGLNNPEGMEKIKAMMQSPEKLKEMAQQVGISPDELATPETQSITDVTELASETQSITDVTDTE